MNITIGQKKLIELVSMQLQNNFLVTDDECLLLKECICELMPIIEKCFSANTNKYYWNKNKKLLFNPYNSSQYTIFLYFLSRLVWEGYNDLNFASKIYYLNKMFNSCDLFYEIKLPDIFFTEHPVGSVIGRANISNYLVFQQNCTIGGNNGAYPILGEFVWLFAGAAVIGSSKIGSNVFISAGTIIKDTDVPDNTIVFGISPNLVFKQKPNAYFYSKSPFVVHQKYGE